MKKDYLEKQKKRLKQKIQLLISNPDFQRDIVALREKWSIPKGGIDSQKDNEKWYSNLLKSTDKYYEKEWPKQRKKLQKLKEQGKIREYKKKQKEANEKAPLNTWHKDISDILIKYRLPPRWREGVKRYLLFNDSENMGMFIGTTIRTEIDEGTGMTELFIRINEDTTLEDVKASWPFVKLHQEGLRYKKQKKYQPIKNFERDKMAYELSQKGKTHKEISDKLSKKYGKDYIYTDVGTFIARHKKRVGIN